MASIYYQRSRKIVCSLHQSTVYAHEGLYAHGINQTLAFTVTLLIATTIII